MTRHFKLSTGSNTGSVAGGAGNDSKGRSSLCERYGPGTDWTLNGKENTPQKASPDNSFCEVSPTAEKLKPLAEEAPQPNAADSARDLAAEFDDVLQAEVARFLERQSLADAARVKELREKNLALERKLQEHKVDVEDKMSDIGDIDLSFPASGTPPRHRTPKAKKNRDLFATDADTVIGDSASVAGRIPPPDPMVVAMVQEATRAEFARLLEQREVEEAGMREQLRIAKERNASLERELRKDNKELERKSGKDNKEVQQTLQAEMARLLETTEALSLRLTSELQQARAAILHREQVTAALKDSINSLEAALKEFDWLDMTAPLLEKAVMAFAIGLFIGYFFFAWIRFASDKLEHSSSMIQIVLTLCCAYWSFILVEVIKTKFDVGDANARPAIERWGIHEFAKLLGGAAQLLDRGSRLFSRN